MNGSKKTGVLNKLKRLAYYRLIVPIKRERKSPKFIARGCLIGLLVGFTPTVGIQMALILGIWWVALYIVKWEFSLITAVAWSWVSNPLTMMPLYFLFYVTGQAMVGGADVNEGYAEFQTRIAGELATQRDGMIDEAVSFVSFLFNEYGYAVLIGCLPYMLILPVMGYLFTLSIAAKVQLKRGTAANM